MDITFSGRQTDVPERFRKHASTKLSKLEKLDQKAIRVDVEVSVERNPRQSSQKERVELTVRSRGPAIRAEAAAEDRFSALDLALAKLESKLRRAHDRRKNHYGHGQVKLVGPSEGDVMALPGDLGPAARPESERAEPRAGEHAEPPAAKPAAALPDEQQRDRPGRPEAHDDVVPIPMEGDGPLVVRQKFHHAKPMTIDQALLEMELVGHDFFLFSDCECGLPSVVYRRRGYQYGVLRLVENATHQQADAPGGQDARAEAGTAANGRSAAGPRDSTMSELRTV
jgi:ribosomal subunit interface protein